jgi:hypothetical protein
MPPLRTYIVPLCFIALAAAIPAVARAQASQTKAVIPRQHQPPPGMCRVWLSEVPADKQPAPTDCATALKNLPANAQVVFGEQKAPARKPVAGTPIPVTSGAASRIRVPTGGRADTTRPPVPPDSVRKAPPDTSRSGRSPAERVPPA